jgi:DNA circularisation protein N-terminus
MSGIPPTIPPGIGPIAQNAGTSLVADQSTATWDGGLWWQQLQPGSWRGVGFVMDAAENRAGRRVAEHTYPYRDTIWVEDLGMLPRRFQIQAFLVGDDVYQQRDAMIAACEQPGEGTLVHPTMGSMQVVLLEFSTTDRRERGRYVELVFSFVISGDITFPQTAIATGDNTNSGAGALDTASQTDFASGLNQIGTIPDYAFSNLGGFTGQAQVAVDDPAWALNAVTGLVGYYGRYSMGNRTTLQPPTATVDSALAAAIVSRGAVLTAISALQDAADALT